MFNISKKNQNDSDIDDILNDSSADPAQQLELVKEILENTQSNIKKALNLLKEKNIDTEALISSLKQTREISAGLASMDESSGSEKIIEGVFNGEKMVSGDGAEFIIPANYASKSKLVEGDILKLTIKKDGSFIYKQIGPVERRQKVVTLVQNEASSDWYGVEDGQRWKLLTASVTYFHGSAGDDVVILVPKDGSSKWAAVENIIKKR
ncbi:MAG: hypothetical protein WCX71_04135 [Candidatus Buchananbacteria bacterium]